MWGLMEGVGEWEIGHGLGLAFARLRPVHS